jgi:hypothetical protein
VTSPTGQKVTFTEDEVRRNLPDKLRAIALDKELAVEGAQENREDVTVVGRIGGPDDDEAPCTHARPLGRWGGQLEGQSTR